MIMRTKSLLILGLMLVTLVTGCSNKAAPPNMDAQKKVINTYLEGLRDSDQKKVLSSIDFSLAQFYVGNPEELKKIFDSQKAMGSISKWEYQDKTVSVDETNNQTLVTVTLTYPMAILDVKFDLRKVEGKWLVYGSDTVKQKNPSDNYHGKGKSTDTKETSDKK